MNLQKCFLKYEAGAGKGRKDRTNNDYQLLESVSTKQFLLNLIPIVKDERRKELDMKIWGR